MQCLADEMKNVNIASSRKRSRNNAEIVGLVMYEHNMSGVPCSTDYTT